MHVEWLCPKLRWVGAGLGILAMGGSWVLPTQPSSLSHLDHLVVRIGVFGVALFLVSFLQLLRFQPRWMAWFAMLAPIGFVMGWGLYRFTGDPTDMGLAGVITFYWSVRCPCHRR